MYRNCIFCSHDLGANEVLEGFPVGSRVAFDAWKGRLWAVCSRCGRWNLAPLEERWEPVEVAERRFRDARLRVQSENVGLAKLPDGTRLIRVGEALPGELAAWRYGDQLVRRRQRYVVMAGAAGAVGLVAIGGGWVLGAGSGFALIVNGASIYWRNRQRRKVVHRVPAEASPTGRPILVRRWHVEGAWMEEHDGDLALHVPDAHREKQKSDLMGNARFSRDVVVIGGAQARALLGRGMVHVNHAGAGRRRVREALGVLEEAGSAEAYLRATARARRTVAKRGDMTTRRMTPPQSLALEMALHDESERRAMAGELAALEAAWRQAEEIAGIADALPDDPLERIGQR